MKRILAVSVLTAVGAMGAAYAEMPRENVGIGLGTMIFEGQTGLVQQVLAATTNGSFGNQTFAITSGTSGAKPYDGIVQNEPLKLFVKDNMDNLARDMAVGQGESLDTLAELMSVPAEQRGAFNQKLQTNFDNIYTSANVTNEDVVQNLAKLQS